ncbi:hypothetical protein OsccyDRAFT_1236 [Leptolyngbyaceae cyanobacterium JSC-12]|nr:hypothetical protein OsccyDRAFT_1236 [Leptolyngbyaceae cyanobacterium JSC-12]
MNLPKSHLSEKRNKVMSPEQFNQVVQAITEGRYSWACVLILRFAGYNPVYFIPYRTYSRLVKENRLLNAIAEPSASQPQPNQKLSHDKKEMLLVHSSDRATSNCLTQLNELHDLEPIDFQENSILGGNFSLWENTLVHNQFNLKFLENSFLSFK